MRQDVISVLRKVDRHSSRRVNLPKRRVIWLEGNGNYSKIHSVTGDMDLMSVTLVKYQNRLPDFIRVHKQSLVNPIHIVDLVVIAGFRDMSFVELSDGTRVKVSRRRINQIRAALEEVKNN